ncbi:Uncharacterized mitochondrial protein AtMg01250, partial [Striga hermonthica]
FMLCYFQFFNSGFMSKSWNHTMITLVPKIQSPCKVEHYRPISLCCVAYKIISKILAFRLKNCLSSCISDNQAAFIPERQLLDNVVIAQEAIHYLNRHRSGTNYFMAIKLDMKKAFDRIEWACIKSVMLKMGFHLKFVTWIMSCISSASFSFNVNGNKQGHVIPTRGLRQGDPMSPYLFIIVSKILSCLLKNSALNGNLTGLKISKNSPPITHLLFADDTLLFCLASPHQAVEILNILNSYYHISGQKINLIKSSIFFSKNTPPSVQASICSIFNGIQIYVMVVQHNHTMPELRFGAGDSRGVLIPHNDALVVTIEIASYDVERVLVDTGSSVDIMFYKCFQQMDLGIEITPIKTSLFGFSGAEVVPLGEVQLLMALWALPLRKVKMVRF